jgi:hypothetical protein
VRREQIYHTLAVGWRNIHEVSDGEASFDTDCTQMFKEMGFFCDIRVLKAFTSCLGIQPLSFDGTNQRHTGLDLLKSWEIEI